MTNENIITAKLQNDNSHITTFCLLCGGPIPIFSSYYKDITKICDKCKQKWAELDKLIVIFNSKNSFE